MCIANKLPELTSIEPEPDRVGAWAVCFDGLPRIRRNRASDPGDGRAGGLYDAAGAWRADGAAAAARAFAACRRQLFARICVRPDTQGLVAAADFGQAEADAGRGAGLARTIYQTIYILPRGELRKEIIGLLRQGRKLRRKRSQGADRRGGLIGMVSVDERPLDVLTRQMPGD